MGGNADTEGQTNGTSLGANKKPVKMLLSGIVSFHTVGFLVETTATLVVGTSDLVEISLPVRAYQHTNHTDVGRAS